MDRGDNPLSQNPGKFAEKQLMRFSPTVNLSGSVEWKKNTHAEPTDSDHDLFFHRMIVITWQCGIVGVKSDQYRWEGGQ